MQLDVSHPLPGVVRLVPRRSVTSRTPSSAAHELRAARPARPHAAERRPGRRHAVRRRRRDGAARRRDGSGAAGDLRHRSARAAQGAPRDRVLTPGGRILDEALVERARRRARGDLAALRPLRGLRRANRAASSPRTPCRSGRYVLSGGELAAMVLIDAVLRKLPGALGHADSAEEESFSPALDGDPEYPHYTRPAEYRGWSVPSVLLSGHHAEIATWRRAQPRAGRDGRPLTRRTRRPGGRIRSGRWAVERAAAAPIRLPARSARQPFATMARPVSAAALSRCSARLPLSSFSRT